MNALADIQPRTQPLAALLHGLTDAALPALDVADVAIDSRTVGQRALFLAFAGTRSHGLDHADQAVERGAVAVAWDGERAPALAVPAIHVPQLAHHASLIAARFYDEPAAALFVTGVTGTDGKTSCAWLLAQALDAVDVRCGYLGTLGYGLLGDLAEASHTTPDAVATQRWLARLRVAGAQAVAFEVSSHALDQHRVDGVAFDTAVLTQVGRDHLDYHGSPEAYAEAKRRLFVRDGLSHAVLNADDAHGRAWLAALDPAVTGVAYGECDVAGLAAHYVRLARIDTRADGLALTVDTHAGRARIDSTLVGRFNAHNLAAVLAVLLARGVDLERAAAALAGVTTVPGRMQRIAAGAGQPLVVVDYAHTPGALEHALRALREHAGARLLCVFGCGGERDSGKRALMGAAAAREADAVWVTDDNPRHESPQAIVDDILAGMAGAPAVTVIHDRAAAIAAAIAAAGADDVVLIAGKGHETTQQVGDDYRPFDDRSTARRALEAA